jgi:hypothetical protein
MVSLRGLRYEARSFKRIGSGRFPVRLHVNPQLGNLGEIVGDLHANQVSGVLPNAWVNRTAISAEIPAFSLARLLRVCRLASRTRAASVTAQAERYQAFLADHTAGMGRVFLGLCGLVDLDGQALAEHSKRGFELV